MYSDQLLDFQNIDFQNIAFIIPSHYYYAILNSLDAGLFFNTIRVSNSLDPDLGPNCLQRLSADN